MPFFSGSSGGTGAVAVVFDTTLAAATNSIDTGALGIPTTGRHLLAVASLRTDEAGSLVIPAFTLNNDGGNSYDRVVVRDINATVTGTNALATTSFQFNAHGNGGLAGQASSVELMIYDYAGTTFNKSGKMTDMTTDSVGAGCQIDCWGVGYRSTAAISRLKLAAASTSNLQVGTHLTIYTM